MSLCLEPASPLVEAHCERLDTFAVLDPARWNALAAQIPFRRWEWLETWWRHYRHNRCELFLLVIHNAEGDVIGVAPWYLERSPIWGRVVRLLGSGEVCSDYVSVLCQPGLEATVTHALAEWLTTRGRLLWDLIDLDGIDDLDGVTSALVEQLEHKGQPVDWRTELSSWRIEFPATFDDWVAQLSKSRREKVRQMMRRMYDSGRAVPHLARTSEEVSEAWGILRQLHGERRNSLGQSGCFASRRFQSFHDEIVDRFHTLGQLRLHWVTLDDQPIAAEYDLTGGDTVFMYQTGFNPQFAEHQPGWLNTIGTLKFAFEQGFKVYDFMRGDEPYKASWRAKPRVQWHVRVAADRLLPRLRDRSWHAGRQLKHWLRERQEQLHTWWKDQSPAPAPTQPATGDAS
jgi:CelD/BcsL family acetyltransferase involved in cellulose biosynthesis